MTRKFTTQFDPNHPLKSLPDVKNLKICDVHVHVWEKTEKVSMYLRIAEEHGVRHALSLDHPDLKDWLDENHAGRFSHAYYLSSRYFAQKNLKAILKQIREAQKHDYSMYKMWFGPRFLDFAKANGPFHLNDDAFLPIYKELENDKAVLFIHVADPDTWYQTKYVNSRKYGKKEQVFQEFKELLERHPEITFVGYHFAGHPEHLDKLDELLTEHSNLYLDTGSTRWMIRELGKNIEKTRDFFARHSDRIMFGIDLSIHEDTTVEYLRTRHWAQRLFWETDHVAPLPFHDEDTNGNTVIRGLNLPTSVLEKLYWENAKKILKWK